MIFDIWTIAFKDIRLDLRRVENFISMFFFTFIILLVFAFALPSKQAAQFEIVSGIFWVAFLLGGILSLNKSFQLEKENACMDALLLSPVSRGALFLGKMTGNLLFIMIVQLFVIPLVSILYNSAFLQHLPQFLLLDLIAAVGFSSLGTLLAGLTTDVRFKEILLPILLFPLLVPMILASIKITQAILLGKGLLAEADWLRLLIGFDLIFMIISYLTFEYVMEL